MAETAYQTHYAGGKRKKMSSRKVARNYKMGVFRKKWKTGGTKHVIASKGGSL